MLSKSRNPRPRSHTPTSQLSGKYSSAPDRHPIAIRYSLPFIEAQPIFAQFKRSLLDDRVRCMSDDFALRLPSRVKHGNLQPPNSSPGLERLEMHHAFEACSGYHASAEMVSASDHQASEYRSSLGTITGGSYPARDRAPGIT